VDNLPPASLLAPPGMSLQSNGPGQFRQPPGQFFAGQRSPTAARFPATERLHLAV